MSKQIPHEIIDRASEWFIEMREMHIADSKREAFTEWLRSSPAHVQAYLEVAGIWGDASHVSKEFPVEFARAATNVIALEKGDFASAFSPLRVPRKEEEKEEEGKGKGAREGDSLFRLRDGAEEEEGLRGGAFLEESTSPHTPETPGPGTAGARATRTPLAIAATLLMLVGIAGWFHQQRGVYYTDTGEQRVITLDDGSIVRLNSQSKVRVRLTPHERNIKLLQGQAHFQVAKDTTRPFTVHTHDITARAVGTQFDVYRRKTGTTVTVVEGRVALVPDTAPAIVPAASGDSPHNPENPENPENPDAGTVARPVSGTILAAGQQATVTPTGTVQLQPQANIAAATGWLQQELIFTGEPLSTVIDEFNRYTRRTIVLDDPTLADHKINAAFNTSNPQALLLFLSRMDGVTVNETDDEIHIRRVSARRPSESRNPVN